MFFKLYKFIFSSLAFKNDQLSNINKGKYLN